jgi:hypothetical protein
MDAIELMGSQRHTEHISGVGGQRSINAAIKIHHADTWAIARLGLLGLQVRHLRHLDD